MAGTPGSYAVADWVAMDCLRLLKNMLEMAGYNRPPALIAR